MPATVPQILMNEVMIANYEKYSSMVKDFQVQGLCCSSGRLILSLSQVLGSPRYPVSEWMLLGKPMPWLRWAQSTASARSRT